MVNDLLGVDLALNLRLRVEGHEAFSRRGRERALLQRFSASSRLAVRLVVLLLVSHLDVLGRLGRNGCGGSFEVASGGNGVGILAGLGGLRVWAEGRSLVGGARLLSREELLLGWRGPGQVADLLVDVFVLPVVAGVPCLEVLVPVCLLDFEFIEERDDVAGDVGEGASLDLLVHEEVGPGVVQVVVVLARQRVLPPVGGLGVGLELFHGKFNLKMINFSSGSLFNGIESAVH